MLGREGGFIFCTFLFCFQERSLFCTFSMVHTQAQCNLLLAAWICWQPVSRSKGWAPPQLSQVMLPQAPHHHSHRIQYFHNGVEFSSSSSSPKLTSLQPSNKHVCPAATAKLVCSCFWFSCLPKSAYLDYNTWSLDYSTLLCQGNAPSQFATAFLLQHVTEEILGKRRGISWIWCGTRQKGCKSWGKIKPFWAKHTEVSSNYRITELENIIWSNHTPTTSITHWTMSLSTTSNIS